MTFPKKQVIELVTKYKEIEYNFKNWLHKQPLAVDAAITAIINGYHAAACIMVIDILAYNAAVHNWSPFSFPPVPFKPVPQTCLIKARDLAVFVGCDAGIQCVMERIKGKDDIQISMASGFGAAVIYAMVRRDPPATAIVFGILTVLVKGGLFKIIEDAKSSQ